MLPQLPFWMRQRQIKLEPIDDTAVALKAPNLPAHELHLRKNNGDGYTVALYTQPTGTTEKLLLAERPSGLDELRDAWQYAFEFFRQKVIV
jgi:hypothetical protein